MKSHYLNEYFIQEEQKFEINAANRPFLLCNKQQYLYVVKIRITKKS